MGDVLVIKLLTATELKEKWTYFYVFIFEMPVFIT
jgi:hypothetical protein